MGGVLTEINGNVGAGLFWQSGPICAKAGVIRLVITIVMLTGKAH